MRYLWKNSASLPCRLENIAFAEFDSLIYLMILDLFNDTRQNYWKISLNVTAFLDLMHDYQVRHLTVLYHVIHLAAILPNSYLLCGSC